MDVLTGVISLASVPGFFYYGALVLIGVFMAGWLFNTKLKGLCVDSVAEIKEEQAKMNARIQTLEDTAIKAEAHQKDINSIVNLITELRNDFKDGFRSITERIDAFFLGSNKL